MYQSPERPGGRAAAGALSGGLPVPVLDCEVVMNNSFPTPFSARSDEPQFMERYSTMSGSLQSILIVVVFLAILAGFIILKDMLKTSEGTLHKQG
jgi:hypothetical protein